MDSMQVSVTATWPALIALLETISTTPPRMITKGLTVATGTPQPGAQDQLVQASFAVGCFRGNAP